MIAACGGIRQVERECGGVHFGLGAVKLLASFTQFYFNGEELNGKSHGRDSNK